MALGLGLRLRVWSGAVGSGFTLLRVQTRRVATRKGLGAPL